MKDRLAPIREQIAAFEREGDVPVLAGPWLGEVGFELLYWIPFLRWFARESPVLRSRLVVLSRGGVANWYHGVTDRYVDLFDHFTLPEFRRRFPKFLKQVASYDDYQRRNYAEGEEELIDLARRAVGAERINVLHPSTMFQYFKWLYDADPRGFGAFYPRLPLPPLGALDGQLPADYVAVRFYKSYALPSDPETDRIAQDVLDRLSARVPVVVLNTPMTIDKKHPDLQFRYGDNVRLMDRFMTLADNLAVQSAIVSRARAYVGNYGGLSYLAPHFGVPSFTLYSEPDAVKDNHRKLAGAVLDKPNLGGYSVSDIREIVPESFVASVLGTASDDARAGMGPVAVRS